MFTASADSYPPVITEKIQLNSVNAKEEALPVGTKLAGAEGIEPSSATLEAALRPLLVPIKMGNDSFLSTLYKTVVDTLLPYFWSVM